MHVLALHKPCQARFHGETEPYGTGNVLRQLTGNVLLTVASEFSRWNLIIKAPHRITPGSGAPSASHGPSCYMRVALH